MQQTELRKMLVYLGCEERLGADNFNKHLEVWFKQYTVEGAEVSPPQCVTLAPTIYNNLISWH